uniref:Methyltransferase domain-containing protein n=1 Tax=Chromera velia CCMP2878 TaxID=1169474 RepID=A0A0G4HWU4_9ALVE|mmetsp:Transcript_37710/g.74154  ORF Transcript_37710/g.74154 Transcript_37710/m.74154 type:complete len:261 (+) Transcript_37710:135-917(+)|eukprot:Cvel_1456.t1-p1 / transcript=Cvel_1456.t1 / gene=Cvel_1456 / organism=Chromera_velia_CCMP2878 / gene_product=hypothetical protein / transcript_product=hypothetical protein / location=Cvel_scaffold51:47949-49035(-) / protein_length=260 / sequence_SO=supercontig / SO=protein_coding / is_pseudo=false
MSSTEPPKGGAIPAFCEMQKEIHSIVQGLRDSGEPSRDHGYFQDFYKKWSNEYDDMYRPLYSGGKASMASRVMRCAEQIRREEGVGEERIIRVLDIGCGTGFLGEAVNEAGGRTRNVLMYGLDYSPEMLEKLREKGEYADAWEGDGAAEQVETKGLKFDIVISSGVIGVMGLPSTVLPNWGSALTETGFIVTNLRDFQWESVIAAMEAGGQWEILSKEMDDLLGATKACFVILRKRKTAQLEEASPVDISAQKEETPAAA